MDWKARKGSGSEHPRRENWNKEGHLNQMRIEPVAWFGDRKFIYVFKALQEDR